MTRLSSHNTLDVFGLSNHSGDRSFDNGDSASESGGSRGADSFLSQEQQQKKRAEKQQEELAAQETRYVRRLKVIVVVALILSMIAVSLSAYFFSASQEQTDFQDQFYDDAVKVLSTMGTNLERTLLACDAFCVSITSFSKASAQTWPFVTIPDFAVRSEKIRSLANSVYANTYHLVQEDQREEWETYTAAVGPTQVNESIAAIEDFKRMDWPIVWNYTSWDIIHSYDEFDMPNPGTHGVNYSGPFLPTWQIQPTIPYDPPYNWDLVSIPKTPTTNTTPHEVLINTHRVVLSEAYLIPTGDVETDEENLDEANWLHDYLPNVETVEEVMQPLSGKYTNRVEYLFHAY